jgi:dephospho-CoA kinase
MMLVVGLTGGIGMGKTAAAALFAARGVPVFNADACVHALYEGKAVPAIEAEFPGTTWGGRVDRKRLAEHVARAPERLRLLERIVHPMVVAAEIEFLREQEKKGAQVAVLEIPLLFETGADTRVDVTVVVSAQEPVQEARVRVRPGMTKEKFEGLRARQLPDAERRARADYVVDSGLPLADMHAELDRLLESLRRRKGAVMERLRHEHPK